METIFNSSIEKFEGDLWGLYLEVPSDIANEFISADAKRVCCSINNIPSFHCAIMSMGGGRFFITLSKPFCKANRLMQGEPVTVRIEKDNSKYGMELGEEFGEVLRQDEVAFEYFEALTPGKQRNLIYFVQQVKTSEIRLRRAFVVCEHLVTHQGKIDFKDLTAEMKAANRRERLN